MKKKIFFVITSLGAGGSEKVFWTLSQGFDKLFYDVTVVLFDSSDNCFSMNVDGVRFLDLKSQRASRSFFKLCKLFREEKPDAVFSTTDHINILISLVSRFVHVPVLIARASNIPDHMRLFSDRRDKALNMLTKSSYKRFDTIVCQSDEMKQSLLREFKIDSQKLIVIPNPVNHTSVIKRELVSATEKKLIIVARLAREKGFDRLLDIIAGLPKEYTLTIVGTGVLKKEIDQKVESMNLKSRITFLSQSTHITQTIAKHDVFVLTSFTEGFPNAVLDALSVGVPVVSFRVGGISNLIRDGFNGYIVEQGDLKGFKSKVIAACENEWDAVAIKEHVYQRCAIDKVSEQYQCLVG